MLTMPDEHVYFLENKRERAEQRQGKWERAGRRESVETFVCEWKEVKDPRCLSKNNERRTPSFPDSVTDSLPLVER